eukprot:jgi/Botrbrau1/23413/Bobra.0051s0057.2
MKGLAALSSACGTPCGRQVIQRLDQTGYRRVHRRRQSRPLCSVSDGDRTRTPDTLASSLQTTSSSELSRPPPAWVGDYSPGHLIGGKYVIEEVLGRGGSATTYKARAPDRSLVAVKALSLRTMRGWKQLDLFQREAKTLKSLQHPGIPKYVDFFEEDIERDRGFFLVQELAEGNTLAQMVADGGHATETEVTDVAIQLLEVLAYLGSLSPPVVHRDVKPENIVIEGGRWGGRLYLVDFGGVQAAAAGSEFLGSTIIGTYGYMAPEQFRGAAQTNSDAYAAGGTLLYLLTGRAPSEFPENRMRIDIGNVLGHVPELRMVVEELLEPLPEDRLSARDALAILRKEPAPMSAELERLRDEHDRRYTPKPSIVTVRHAGNTLEIDIPREPLISGSNIGLAGFAITWNGIIATWTVAALSAGSLLTASFSIPFWVAGYQVAKDAFGRSFSGENLVFRRKQYQLKKSFGEPVTGKIEGLNWARIILLSKSNGVSRRAIMLYDSLEDRNFFFAEGLSSEDQLYVCDQINAHVAKMTGRDFNPPPYVLERKHLPMWVSEDFRGC